MGFLCNDFDIKKRISFLSKQMNAYVENKLENIKEKEWNFLVQQNVTNTIFQPYEWHIAWWNSYGADKELFLICIFKNNTLKGIAPLMITINQGVRILKFIGDGRSDYSDFIYPTGEEDVLKAIFICIGRKRSAWDKIELNNIPSYSKFGSNIEIACRNGKIFCDSVSDVQCPTVLLNKDEKHVEKILNKKSLKRHRKYFQQKGGYKVLHLYEEKEIIEYLVQFFDQHIRRWRNSGVESLFINKDNCTFYRNLLYHMCRKKWIVFTVVESESIPVAFHYGFTYGNKFIWYKPSFEISLSRYYPGEVMLQELLEYAVKKKCCEFDFTRGGEFFKSRFSNKTRLNISYRFMKKYSVRWLLKFGISDNLTKQSR